MASTVSQSVAQMPTYFTSRDAKSDARKAQLYQMMPSTPVYSRPGSSCSQPPTLYSNGVVHKGAMMLEADVYDNSQLPSTPPLSTSGSAMGSPKMADAMQTPMNPMFSGLDGLCAKDVFESVETSVLDWSSSGSPPMTPVYLASQPPMLYHSASDLQSSTTSCPSLSPSPAPQYARSISSEHNFDFCDPRNLTVSAGNNPTLAPELALTSLGDVEIKAAAQPTFDFATHHGLPTFQDIDELDSEDGFGSLVNIEPAAVHTDATRPRACTGSSVVSLGHCSFIGEDELSFDDDSFFPSLPSPPVSTASDDAHKSKKQKKSHKTEATAVDAPVAETAANVAQPVEAEEVDHSHLEHVHTESNDNSSEDAGSPQMTAPTSRRGRKQSLTEDPSKTFVCDLCNRRFRRQEHLKRHYRSLHTQEKPFECNECGKKFSRSDNLAQHARTHSGGAIVMDLLENPEAAGFDGSQIGVPGEDYSAFGKALFQATSEMPSSASDVSSEDASDGGKKKRKRSD